MISGLLSPHTPVPSKGPSDVMKCALIIYGLYYKPITIVNDDSSIVNKLETSLIDDARVIIHDHHMFIVLATVPIYMESIFQTL
jgi:hypothetical protein